MKFGNKLAWSSVIILCTGLFLVGQLHAQETTKEEAYKTLPIADQYKDVAGDATDRANSNKQRGELMKRRREMQSAVSNFLKNKSSSANESSMQQWLTGYVIPSMAQNDDASLADLGKNRKNFFRNYLPKEASAQRRDQVIKLVVPAMEQIAKENFHPACRINAVILVSLLNSREGNRSTGQLPVPYAPTLDWLNTVLKGDCLLTTPPGYERFVSAFLHGVEYCDCLSLHFQMIFCRFTVPTDVCAAKSPRGKHVQGR